MKCDALDRDTKLRSDSKVFVFNAMFGPAAHQWSDKTTDMSLCLKCISCLALSGTQSSRTFLCVHIPRDRKLTRFEKSSAGTLHSEWRLVAGNVGTAPASLTLTRSGTWPPLPALVTRSRSRSRVKTRTQGQHLWRLGPAVSDSVSLALPWLRNLATDKL